MSRSLIAAVSCLVLLCSGCATRSRDRDAHTVLLVSIDGLPASVPGSGRMPTLDAIARDGAQAAWLRPSQPTLTFPNHYTLVTGLRPDHHGIVHNTIRDATLGRYVSKEASARDGRWYGGEPIWATLQKQGGIAATMFWPGSEAEIAGQRPRYRRAFDGTLPVASRVDQVLAWLDLPARERPQLVTLYLEQFDVAAHAAGIASAQADAAMADLDAGLARLRTGLQARGLLGRTDLLVLSDHGMADVPAANVRYLDDVVATDAIRVEYAGQLVGLAPLPGQSATIERALLGRHDRFACWRKDATPPRWAYGTHPRIPAIVCQSDVGWRLSQRQWPAATHLKGEHGFDVDAPEMRAMFVASGPSFRAGVRLPAFDNVAVYPLLAHLLHVAPAANDGDLAALRPALVESR